LQFSMGAIPPALVPICKYYLIGSYSSALLLVVVILLTIKCMSQKQDKFTIGLVIVMLANDVLKNASIVATVQKNCSPSDGPLNPIVFWSTPLGMVAKAISAWCEHIYLIRRFYKLSKNVPLSVFLLLLTTAHAGCHFTSAGWLFSHPSVAHKLVGGSLNVRAHRAGWSMGCATDILVAVGIAWQLVRLDVSFTATQSIIHQFLLATVVSGGLTAVCGIIIIALLSKRQYSYLVLAITMEKIYCITVLSNLVVASAIMQKRASVNVQTPTIRGWFTSAWSASLGKPKSSTVLTSKPSDAGDSTLLDSKPSVMP